jgi:transcriptional regulator
MYVPKKHAETDLAVLHALIRSHPLATWATHSEGEIIVNHLPLLLDATRGSFGTLMGHIARANPVWQCASRTVPSALVFHGPESYISPSWYPSKHAHGAAVPTWNYAVVHAHGIPLIIEDQDWLLDHVTRLTNEHEAAQALPWKVSDAPAEFIERMLKQIVGIEIPISRILGKWKINQNRSTADRLGVVAGLLGAGDTPSVEMATLVEKAVAAERGG